MDIGGPAVLLSICVRVRSHKAALSFGSGFIGVGEFHDTDYRAVGYDLLGTFMFNGMPLTTTSPISSATYSTSRPATYFPTSRRLPCFLNQAVAHESFSMTPVTSRRGRPLEPSTMFSSAGNRRSRPGCGETDAFPTSQAQPVDVLPLTSIHGQPTPARFQRCAYRSRRQVPSRHRGPLS